MKKVSLLILLAALLPRFGFAVGVAGMYQKIYSGSSDECKADPEDGGVVIAAGAALSAVAAGNPSITYTDPDTGTSYTIGKTTSVGYKGVMQMTAGTAYTFVKNFDDNGHIRIVNPDGNTTNAVLDSTSWDAVTYNSFTPTVSGWHTVVLYLGNGGGGVGPTTAPFTSSPYASLLWNDAGLSSCTADNRSQWHRFINDDEGDTLGTYLYTDIPSAQSLTVKGDPENLGDIAYGTSFPDEGAAMTCNAFDGAWTNAVKNMRATCTGYTVYTNTLDGTMYEIASGETTSYSFTMPKAYVTVVWHFDREYKVSATSGANGSITTVDGWYRLGDVIDPEPTGAEGYGFFDWTIADGSSAVAINDEKFMVKGATAITANFAPMVNLEPGTDVINTVVTNHLASSSDPIIFNLAAGTYKETQQTNCVKITGAVHIVGTGADTIVTRVNQNARIFYLDNARSCVRNLVIAGGYGNANTAVWSGGAAYITANGGTIVDCVVRNSGVWTYNSCGGGLYMLGGLVSRCIVSNCQTQVGYGAAGGSGIHAKDCIIENSLIIANKIGGNSNAASAAGGVSLYGTAELLNSTVVMNGSTSAYVGGVYLGSTTAKMVNTAVFGNIAASDKIATVKFATGADSTPRNCASDDASPMNSYCIATDTPAFTSEGEPNRDYTLTVSSPLRNVGKSYSDTDACSATDLAGNARISQTGVDIGCYEYQSTGLSCAFTASMPDGLTPATATFTATAEGGTGAITYKWDFNDDGTIDETTTEPVIEHVYTDGGKYSVKLIVTDGTTESTAEHLNLLQVCQKDVYVATDGSATSPYADWTSATASFADAVDAAVDGCVIHVADGDYTLAGQVSVTKAIKIIGESGDYTKVSVESASYCRCFYIDNADCLIAGIAMHGDSDSTGRTIKLENQGGTLSNCWIKCAMGHSGGYWGVRGAAIDGYRAHITHCVVSGKGQMNTGDSWDAGCAVSLYDGSTIDNTIIRDTENVYNGDSSGNVIGLKSGSTMMNCTIVNATNTIATASAVYVDSTSYVTNSVFFDLRGPTDSGYVRLICSKGVTNNLYKCATEDADFVLGNPNCVAIDAADFRDYANGDYRPAAGGKLFDGGVTMPGQKSEKDLLGKPRVMGKAVDIGCYEASVGGLRIIVR